MTRRTNITPVPKGRPKIQLETRTWRQGLQLPFESNKRVLADRIAICDAATTFTDVQDVSLHPAAADSFVFVKAGPVITQIPKG